MSVRWRDKWGNPMKAIGCAGNMPRTMLIEADDLPPSCRIENGGSIQSNAICPVRVQHPLDGVNTEGEP